MCFCSKGDYDSAIAQYIRTIGKLEPSYVIRKVSSCSVHVCVCVPCTHVYTMSLVLQFLDAQRIHNLTAYLTVSTHN